MKSYTYKLGRTLVQSRLSRGFLLWSNKLLIPSLTWFSRLLADFLQIHLVTVVQGFQVTFYCQFAVEIGILRMEVWFVEIESMVKVIAT